MAKRKCQHGVVQTGKRKGLCRKRPLSGAAARGHKRKIAARRTKRVVKATLGRRKASAWRSLKAPSGTWVSSGRSGGKVFVVAAPKGARMPNYPRGRWVKSGRSGSQVFVLSGFGSYRRRRRRRR